MVIRKLCSLLDSSSIYMNLARILNTKTDLVRTPKCDYSINLRKNKFSQLCNSLQEFTSLMVQTLNLILLTAPELSPLRKALQNRCYNTPESLLYYYIVCMYVCMYVCNMLSMCALNI